MKIFHGWKMAFAAAGLQLIQAMVLYQAFGAYVAALATEMGWSKTSLSAGSAMLAMEAALLGPALGWFLDRFGSGGVIRAGIILFGLGFVSLSQIDTLAGFYFSIVIVAVGMSMFGYFPLNVAVIQWFEKKRARALSVVGLGFAVGGLFVPIIASCIEIFGWRYTALGSGLASILIGYPLASFFRRRPEDFGEVVDGIQKDEKSATVNLDSQRPSEPAFTASQALRTQAFWLLAAGHAFALVVVMTVNTHAINHMRISLDFSISHASLFIMGMTAFQVLGVLLGGYLGDKFEKRLVASACMLLHAAAMVALTYATSIIELVLFAVAHGLAWGVRGPFMQAIRADYFGRRSIGMILGISATIAAIGQTIGPVIAGMLGDLTGNYEMGFNVISAIAVLGAFAFFFARRPAPLPNPDP